MNKLLLLIIALIMNACIFNDTILPDSGCVTKILIRATVVNEVKYNKQNRPVEIIDTHLTDQTITSLITYKKEKISQIVRESNDGKFISDVAFLDDNKVLVTTHLKPEDVECLIEFKNNLPVRIGRWWKSSLNSKTESVLHYDANDNLQKAEVYEANTLIATYEYTAYDDKKNFYYDNLVDWTIIGTLQTLSYGAIHISASRNNPLSYQVIRYNSGQSSSCDYNFVYQYNNNNYPIAVRLADAPTFETFIEYKK